MHCLLFNFNCKLSDNVRALGCYRIAHYVREHGWDAEVIEYAAGWDLPRLQELARSRITQNTKWIGSSHMFSDWNSTMEDFFAWIKKTYPWIRIISGSAVNPHFHSSAIDYYIQGYGELALLHLLKYLFSNGPAPRFDLLSNGARKVIPAIDYYPAYPMSSLMVKYQPRDFILPGEHLGIEFSRGCKFNCSYCNFPVLGVKGDYSRDADDFRAQMLDAYDHWGVTGYSVADETFNDRTEKIAKFADVVETLPFEPWFTGYVRADLLVARPQDRVELARMNFRGHFYGIESFNYAAAKTIGKGMQPDRLKQGLIDVRKYFESVGSQLYRGEISLIAGLPGETIEDLEMSKKWLRRYWTGQYWTLHALTIFAGDSKPSTISANPELFGYNPLTDNEVVYWKNTTNYTVNNSVSGAQDALLGNNTIYWKSSTMNYFQADQLSNQWYKESASTVSPSRYTTQPPFRLGFAIFHELSMSERLKLDNYAVQPIRQKNMHSIVDNYINKKLSL